MAEYILGFELIREPDQLLDEGAVIETHTHNQHHNTDFTLGTWDVVRKQPILNDAGERTGWLELPAVTIKGGGPRATIPIPANMEHSFTLVKGPGFYRCRFVHRDDDGKPSEQYDGNRASYV